MAMLGLLPLIGVRLCFLGTAFLELGHQHSGPPRPVGRISREDAWDRVTVWALGFQKPTGMRKPSKSAAPEDRAKLWLPSKDICRFHFRWETQLIGGGLSPTEVYVENRSQGYHYPSVTSRFSSSVPWQDGTHGSVCVGSFRTSHDASLDRDPQ